MSCLWTSRQQSSRRQRSGELCMVRLLATIPWFCLSAFPFSAVFQGYNSNQYAHTCFSFLNTVFRSGNLQSAGVRRWKRSSKTQAGSFTPCKLEYTCSCTHLPFCYRKASMQPSSATSPDLHTEASCWTPLAISCPSKSFWLIWWVGAFVSLIWFCFPFALSIHVPVFLFVCSHRKPWPWTRSTFFTGTLWMIRPSPTLAGPFRNWVSRSATLVLSK